MNFTQVRTWYINALSNFWLAVKLAKENTKKHDIFIHAAALTFYVLLSIVPVAALIFSIAKGFGYQALIATYIKGLPIKPEATDKFLSFIQNTLVQAQGGIIAGIGVVLLCWSALKLLGSIERSFNMVWEVTRARSVGRKLADYFSVLFFCPLAFVLANTVLVYINTKVTKFILITPILGSFTFIIPVILKLFSVFGIIAGMFALFTLVPAKKVKIVPAFVAACFSGIVYLIFQTAYVSLQVGLTKYNAIYGSLAAVPFLMVWVQMSWLVVLVGAELCATLQNTRGRTKLADNLCFYSQLELSFGVLFYVIENFKRADTPISLDEIATKLNIHPIDISNILSNLVQIKLLFEIKEDDDISGFVPAMSPELISLGLILERLAKNNNFKNNDLILSQELYSKLETMWNVALTSGNKILLDKLILLDETLDENLKKE